MSYIRAVATALEKTPTDYSLILKYRRTNRFSNKKKKKVAIPYSESASAIQPRPDTLNVMLQLKRCPDGMR